MKSANSNIRWASRQPLALAATRPPFFVARTHARPPPPTHPSDDPQSTCGAYELLFSLAPTNHAPPMPATAKPARAKTQSVSASSVRDVRWATDTCTFGWSVQGIWPKFSDGTDVNATHARGDLVLTADDAGEIKAFNSPCVKEHAESVVGRGHSSHVTNVRWIGDGAAITTGGNDRSILVWRVARQQNLAMSLGSSSHG